MKHTDLPPDVDRVVRAAFRLIPELTQDPDTERVPWGDALLNDRRVVHPGHPESLPIETVDRSAPTVVVIGGGSEEDGDEWSLVVPDDGMVEVLREDPAPTEPAVEVFTREDFVNPPNPDTTPDEAAVDVPDPAPQGRWVVSTDRSVMWWEGVGAGLLNRHNWHVAPGAWDALVALVRRANQPDPTWGEVDAWLSDHGAPVPHAALIRNVLAAVAALREDER
jgi:hypothetical protein